MHSGSDSNIQGIQQKFQELVQYVAQKAAEKSAAHEVELDLFRKLLSLGAELLKLFFLRRASSSPAESVRAPDGSELKQHDRRQKQYFSVFGKITFRRGYFRRAGYDGICPVDAELHLPERCYSYLLVDWANYCATDESFDESNRVIERILGISISKSAAETMARENASHVQQFYEQKLPPGKEQEGSILVVEGDGKGIPMRSQGPQSPPQTRLGKGEKRGKKKEAIVTGMYTIAPYFRTAQEIVKALLFPEKKTPGDASTSRRPHPVGKELRATLDGKDTALQRLEQRVQLRDGEHIEDRVALTDGAEALQTRMRSVFPGFTLVLDIIHASEYLWKVVNALLGEKHPQRTEWMAEQLLDVLSGKTAEVIRRLKGLAEQKSLNAAQRAALQSTIGYYERNLPYMRYHGYLKRGWPIGTGVVEGACGHLVKDRMEGSGMRWIKAGAQALLDLRSVRVNGDWEAYQGYHRHCEQHRLYGDDHFAGCTLAEAEALNEVA